MAGRRVDGEILFFAPVRAPRRAAHTAEDMERAERNRLRFVPAGTREPGAGDVGRALNALSDADLVRLKALARSWSRGLPGGIGSRRLNGDPAA